MASEALIAVSLEREMFPAWTAQELYGYRGKGRFLDIGTSESYSLAERFFVLRKETCERRASP